MLALGIVLILRFGLPEIGVSPISKALDPAPKGKSIAAFLFRHPGCIEAHSYTLGIFCHRLHSRVLLREEVRMFHDSVPENVQRGFTVFVHRANRRKIVGKGDELSVVHKG